MRAALRFFYLTTVQIRVFIRWSAWLARLGPPGRLLSIWCDNAMLALYGLEVASRSLNVKNLVVGHSTGVVLGGNGIRCSGTLHLSSGVVFARRYSDGGNSDDPLGKPLFVIEGDVTIGANSVLMGPLTIRGPVIIGALSLVTAERLEPGVYVGSPAKKIRDIA